MGDYGTVFALTPAGTLTVLRSYELSDGGAPLAGLIADAAGNLYGTTFAGGANDYGAVFELAGSGFIPPKLFPGTPGSGNCIGQSISSLAKT